MDSEEHPARTQTHFRAQTLTPTSPCLRTFARIPTHEPRHACALSCPTARPGFAPSAHLRPHSHSRAAPRLRTFAPNPTIRFAPSAHLRPYPDLPAAPGLRTFVPNPTIRLCPVCAPSPAFRPTSRATPAHFCAQPHDPALSRLRTFVRIPTHEPRHACAPSPAFPPTSRATPAHLRPHSHSRAAPRLRTPFLFSTYFFTHFYVLFHPLLRTCSTNH